MMNSIKFGVARGVFSNEAGLGSAAITASSVSTDNHVRSEIRLGIAIRPLAISLNVHAISRATVEPTKTNTAKTTL